MGRDGSKLFAPALQNSLLEWKDFYITEFLAIYLQEKYLQMTLRLFPIFDLLENEECDVNRIGYFNQIKNLKT